MRGTSRFAARMVDLITFAVLLTVVLGITVVFGFDSPVLAAGSDTVALTGPYELFCGVGGLSDLVINDVSTTATITPAGPASGGQFELTDYQTSLTLPQSLISAAQSSGPVLDGYVNAQVDATGATPAVTVVGPLDFSGLSTTDVPATGDPVSLPSSPETLGPFSATSGSMTIQEDTDTTLVFDLGGAYFPMACSTYPDDALPSGRTSAPPSVPTIDPVIAVAGGGAAPIPPGTTTPPPAGRPAICSATPVLAPQSPTPTWPSGPQLLDAVQVALAAQYPTVYGGIITAPPTPGESQVQANDSLVVLETVRDPALEQEATAAYPAPFTLAFQTTPYSYACLLAVQANVEDTSGEAAAAGITIVGVGIGLEPPAVGVIVTNCGQPAAQEGVEWFAERWGSVVAVSTCQQVPQAAAGVATEPTSPGGRSGSGGNGGQSEVSASPSELAFTGTGAAVRWVALVGSALLVMGVGLLVLTGVPSRASARLLRLPRAKGPGTV